ncbi:MAG: phosphate ABC transporter permease subunit PstC [Candidatus Freyarchaeota archaeon]|nr:phosphate ABC transporter permease subunit PstC [Candidatus Jordarchaeia archaeon]MBS7278281.1 phosphate ABC transporter permease subunit PstC [Candidatus Jordarchaeia archaeon]
MRFDGKFREMFKIDFGSGEVSGSLEYIFTAEDFKKVGLKIREFLRRFFSPEGLTALCAFSSLVITGLIFFFLFREAFPMFQKMSYGSSFLHFLYVLNPDFFGYAIDKYGLVWFSGGNPFLGFLNFVSGGTWAPNSYEFGILPLIIGTLIVVGGAVAISLPIGVLSAVHLAEYCSLRVKNVLKPVIEMLAGIPSVVFGLVGLTLVVPLIQNVFHLDNGRTALSAAIVLAIMILPTIISVSEDAISAVPREFKEASFALGATHFQTVRKVILPAAAAGIAAAVVLAVARAIGETMAVLMIAGNSPFTVLYPNYFPLLPVLDKFGFYFKELFLDPIMPMTATIAAEIGETSWGSTHYQALLAVGFVLFIITYIINYIAEVTIFRFSKKVKRRRT